MRGPHSLVIYQPLFHQESCLSIGTALRFAAICLVARAGWQTELLTLASSSPAVLPLSTQ